MLCQIALLTEGRLAMTGGRYPLKASTLSSTDDSPHRCGGA